MQGSSFGKGFAKRLDEHAFQRQRAQPLFERSAFAGFAGVVGLRSQDAQGAGVDRDLGDKAMVAVLRLNCRTSQHHAITD